MCVKVWWRFCEDEEFTTNSWLSHECQPAKRPREKHILEFEKSLLGWISQVIYDSGQHASDPQNSLPDVFKCAFSHTFTNTIQTLITHEIVRRTRSFSKKHLREKILAKHLRVRDCLPIIIYIISLKFPLLLPLHLHILERFLTQTLTSPILSVKRSFGAYGKHWKKPLSGGCNLELIAGSGQLVKTWLRETCW